MSLGRAPGAAALAAAAATLLTAAGAGGAFRNVTVGEAPPAFALVDLSGRDRGSGEVLGGEVTVIVFWATWSPRSAEVLADLERLSGELGRDRVRLVAVSADHERFSDRDRVEIRKVLAETAFTGEALVDEGLVAFNAYGAMALPSSVVVDGRGRVAYTLAGYPTTMRGDLSDAVRKALGLPTSAELAPPQPVVPKNHALQYYSFGSRLLEKGQEEKAADQFRKAVERDPEYVAPRVALGLHHLRQGDAAAAAEEFRRARAIAPHDPEVLYQGALAELGADRTAEAEALFGKLAEEYPDRAGYLLGRALARRFGGSEEGYREDRELAAGLVPPGPRLLRDLGEAAEARGELALAAELYREALRTALR